MNLITLNDRKEKQMKKKLISILLSLLSVLAVSANVLAAETGGSVTAAGLRQVQQYNFAIGILAMLLVGFGFLMVFVKKYGYGATTGTYLVVGAGLPLYLLLRSTGILSAEAVAADQIGALLLAEFAVAAALISMGAVLGRLRVYQYALLAILIVPLYMLNEWLVLDGGLGITKGFVDAAGSIVIHAFGAYFGLGLTIALTNASHLNHPIESDETSDRFSMLGSMVLWLFWPSFCSAIVPEAQFAQTVINTILALCGATLATFLCSALMRKGKIAIADMANASLAGGVAIGATCNRVTAPAALGIGVLAGIVCVAGYTLIQPKIQARCKIVDTCGVHNLHGMPGLLGGLIAIAVVPGIATAQLIGIAFTVVLAFAGGTLSGYLIRLTGTKKTVYEDQGAEIKRKNRKHAAIAAAVSIFFVLAVLCFALSVIPLTSKIHNNVQGILIYQNDVASDITCTVDITGTYTNYLFRDDYFDGRITLNGVGLVGGSPNRYTFGTHSALTSYYYSLENSDGTLQSIFKGDVLLNLACNAIVISTCFDHRKGLESTDESFRCLIIAPAGDEPSAENTLQTFVADGLFSHFTTWDFITISWR